MILKRAELVEEGRRFFQKHVVVDPPVDLRDAERRRLILLKRYDEILGELPEKCALQPDEVYRRKFSDHVEVKVTYHAEVDDLVHSYLLIPRNGSHPYAGIVVHHQCRIDCDYGKESVLGKVLERTRTRANLLQKVFQSH